MAEKQQPTGTGKSRTALLALLVIAGVAGGVHFLGGSDDKPAPKEYVDDDVVEVAPLVPASRMSGASWRSADQVREDRATEAEAAGDAGESVFDQVQWDADDKELAYDKSVEQTVKDIDGLGIYVAPADSAKKKAPAKKKEGAK
ncbi:MAG TPA: hypothetical protein VFY93_03785 [Planctomycetota bacterium]|nr:hypothetical protein [Planctomycetota bacterium]